MQYKTLSTERFVLKVLTPEMVGEEYLSWFSAEGTSNYISYAKKKVTIDNLMSYVQEKLLKTDAIFWGIFLKSNSDHIGNIKFEPIDFNNHIAVLGVLIGNQEWRGKGVFSEISKVIEKDFSENGIKKIWLGVEKINLNAIKAYLKEGYIIDNSNPYNIDLNTSVCMLKEI